MCVLESQKRTGGGGGEGGGIFGGRGGGGKKGGVFLEGVGVERERVPQAGSDGGNSAYDDEREGIYKMSSCMWPTARYE